MVSCDLLALIQTSFPKSPPTHTKFGPPPRRSGSSEISPKRFGKLGHPSPPALETPPPSFSTGGGKERLFILFFFLKKNDKRRGCCKWREGSSMRSDHVHTGSSQYCFRQKRGRVCVCLCQAYILSQKKDGTLSKLEMALKVNVCQSLNNRFGVLFGRGYLRMLQIFGMC